MSPEQQRVLLHKHCTGDFPGQRATTVYWLVRHGYLAHQDKRIVVTDKGRQYYDLHHLEMNLVHVSPFERKCVHGGDLGEHIRGEHETSIP